MPVILNNIYLITQHQEFKEAAAGSLVVTDRGDY